MNSVFEQSEWKAWAECAKDQSDMLAMFPTDGDGDGIEAAKALCRVCPVLAECLAEALDNGEQHGVWGGMTTEERKLLRRRKNRAANQQVI